LPISPWIRRHGLVIVVLLGTFILSRVAAQSVGVRFNQNPLEGYWQYADPELLRHDLPRTLWYFHAQPPGFNGFLGLVLHLPDRLEKPAFVFVFLVCGVVILLAMYALATSLGVPRSAAAGIALAFVISPAALAYENLLFYPYPVAALLCVTFLGLLRYLRTSSLLWGGVLFGASAALVFTRATYHLLWFVGLVAVVLFARPTARRRTCALALVPLVFTTGLYVKNWFVFGEPTTSSWFGMNFAHLAQPELHGQLSLTRPFDEPAAFGANEREPTGVPVLDEQRKRRGGINYNHIVYVDAGHRYLRADLASVRRHPVRYARVVGRSVSMAFLPATNGQGGLSYNMKKLANADRLYNGAIGWQPRRYSDLEANERRRAGRGPDVMHVAWSIVLIYALALATLPVIAWPARWRNIDDAASAWVLAAASATIWLSFIANNAFDIGENARFRFETDPLAWVLAATAISMLVGTTRRPRVPSRAP
jgi:hypothetical protein